MKEREYYRRVAQQIGEAFPKKVVVGTWRISEFG